MGTPRGRWPRAGGKGEQGARWGVGRRAATQRNSLSFARGSGETNLLSPGPRVFSRPTSGSAGPPRSAAPAPSHAPLTRHLSPGLRFVCAFFFPSSRARHRPPPPPPPPSASLPRADYLSRAALRIPGMPSAPGVRASHRQATRAGSEQRWGRQGRGARAGQNLRPRRSPLPIQGLGGQHRGAVRAGRGVAAGGGGEDRSSLDLGRDRARGRGEAARARRAKGARAVQ